MTPRQPRWLAPALGATGAAVLVAALLVAVTRDGGDADAVLVGDAATTTTSTSDTSAAELPSPDAAASDATSPTAPPPPEGAPAGGETAAPSGATATTAAPAADLGAPQDPGPVAAPRPGGYRYRTVTDDGSGSKEEEETVTTVTDERREGDEVVQVIDGKFGGIESSSRVRWRPSDAHLLETTFRMSGSDGRCDWEPDHLEGSFPLREGHTWSASSSCELSGFGPTPITVTRETTATVVRLERRRVAGQVLDLWVVEAKEHVEFSSVVIDVAATRWFSPPHGLTVRTEGSSSGSGPRGSTSFESELLNLQPEQL